MKHYDLIVIGTGGVGSATAYYAAQAGLNVLGIDRFNPPHHFGSSHGQTRVIRMAYFEHPDYVPLLKRAYENWETLEKFSKQNLYHEVGLIEVGPSDGIVIPGVLESSEQYNLPLQKFSKEEAAKRFSGFHFPDDHQIVFEQRAGYLMVENCIATYLEQAKNAGASLHTEETLKAWEDVSGEIEVKTDKNSYRCKKLVITTGAWASDIPGLNLPLTILKKHLYWYQTNDSCYHVNQQCPVFFFEDNNRFFYGFPEIGDHKGVKVSEHGGGDIVTDPATISRDICPDDQAGVEEFLAKSLPQVSHNMLDHAVCMYTMTPDHHFIVDYHPENSNMIVTAGLSGHGFKFASALGETISQLAINNSSALPIDFLSLSRFY